MRAFVQHAAQEMRHPLLAERGLSAAALEGEAHGDQRDGVLLDEPGRYAAGAFDNLYLHGLGPADWE